MKADKVFRIVSEDIDGDGNEDLTVTHNQKKIATIYDWKSVVISWIVSTTALFAAGMGIVTFGM
jgi:hypothetical protein